MASKSLYDWEREIGEIVEDLDLYSYYQLLELEPGASADAVYGAYEARAGAYLEIQRTHACNAMMLRNLTVLLNRLAEARHVLTDPALRAEYDRGLELGNMRLAVEVPLPAPAPQAQPAPAAEEFDDRVEPVDRDYLDELSGQLAADLEQGGIEYAVQQLIEDAPIDPEHVDQKVEQLQRELDELGVPLQEEEPTFDDESVDAGYAAEVVARMEDELTEMGIEIPDSDTHRGLDQAALDDPRVRPVMPTQQQRSRRPEEQKKTTRPGAVRSQKRFKELMGRYGAKSPPKPKK
jgi:curved DNA-binding protein CbpA